MQEKVNGIFKEEKINRQNAMLKGVEILNDVIATFEDVVFQELNIGKVHGTKDELYLVIRTEDRNEVEKILNYIEMKYTFVERECGLGKDKLILYKPKSTGQLIKECLN